MKLKLRIACTILIIALLAGYNGQVAADLELKQDAALSQIWINGLLIDNFNPQIQTYRIVLESEEGMIPEVTAQASDQSAEVMIEPATRLPGGTVITVKAKDGTVKTYIVMFKIKTKPKKSSDATLCEIRINGRLLKHFDPLKYKYSMELPSNEEVIPVITAIANDSKAEIEIIQASDLPGKAIINVTAEDGRVMTYSIAFTVAAKRIASNDKEVLKYYFDKVKVVYAARFVAEPVDISEDSWLTDIVGGLNKKAKVTLGVVNLITDGRDFMQEFIKLEGAHGSERFLATSNSYEYYEGTNKIKSIKSLYWSAKVIQGTTVVKNFNGPIKAVILWRDFDEDQNITSIALTCYNDFETTKGFYYIERPSDNYYTGDINTLKYTGSPIVNYSN